MRHMPPQQERGMAVGAFTVTTVKCLFRNFASALFGASICLASSQLTFIREWIC